MAELSVRYAASLFDLAVETGRLDTYLDQAGIMRDKLGSEECRGILEHPHLSGGEKRDFLESVFAGNIHDDLMGFLYTLAKDGGGDIIPLILETFINMGFVHIGKTVATVVSAAALSEGQMASLGNILSKKVGKRVEIEPQVDPSLIGGFYVRVDGCLIDRTLKKKLSDLTDSIIRGDDG